VNRRQFLAYTIAIGAAAPFARMIQPAEAQPAVAMPPILWSPTQAEVDEWLAYYKIAVRQGVERFADIVQGAPEILIGDDGKPYVVNVVDQHLFEEAERAFHRLDHDRQAVAWSQGQGYYAGRNGLPRENPRYTGPSHEAFGWYNMWAVGDRDRRGVRLPRSPGVTWPEGRRPNPWLKFQ